jgi:hypothetical protein
MLFDQNLLGFHLHVGRCISFDLDVLVHCGCTFEHVTHCHLVICALKEACRDQRVECNRGGFLLTHIEFLSQFKTSALFGLVFEVSIGDTLLLEVVPHVDRLEVLDEDFTELVLSK